MTDAELALWAAEGDRDAFGVLVERHAATARRLARAILLNGEDADDAAQDGFLSAWRAMRDFDVGRPFRPWLLRIVANAARDLRRRRRVREAEPLAPDVATAGLGPDRETDRVLLREAFARALAALPERQRVALTMYDAEGYPHAEIATVLGVAEGTVRADLFHARRAVRSALAPFLEEGRDAR
ncbi:MAG: RNA polymerase sigma factor [Gemmatimonadales bacterium]|nr:RNA polymerase sigma factor [Gemmatimonadales bacterium]